MTDPVASVPEMVKAELKRLREERDTARHERQEALKAVHRLTEELERLRARYGCF
jgi:uncharacterized protein (DUF3084 family)